MRNLLILNNPYPLSLCIPFVSILFQMVYILLPFPSLLASGIPGMSTVRRLSKAISAALERPRNASPWRRAAALWARRCRHAGRRYLAGMNPLAPGRPLSFGFGRPYDVLTGAAPTLLAMLLGRLACRPSWVPERLVVVFKIQFGRGDVFGR